MKVIIVALITFLLAGCATHQKPAYVGDMDNMTSTITWVKVSEKDIGGFCDKLTYDASKRFSTYEAVRGPNQLMVRLFPSGCSKYLGNQCTIYVAPPSDGFSLEVFGHEVLHCFIGDYHN